MIKKFPDTNNGLATKIDLKDKTFSAKKIDIKINSKYIKTFPENIYKR